MWKDCGSYLVHTAEQGTRQWILARERVSLTASKFGAAVGHSDFDSPKDLSLQRSGTQEKVIPARNQAYMKHGTVTEPIARQWYEDENECFVNQIGLAVPKWDKRIAGSADGIVGEEGIIEIKCPNKFYRNLSQHEEKLSTGWKPPKLYHAHIFDTHYDQMQGCMAILGRKWCDYIVYTEEVVYTERIPFHEAYWKEELYPGIVDYLENVLKPAMGGVLPELQV